MTDVKNNFEIARSIVRRYMANYTLTRTAPKGVKGGFFAMIASDTGEVWLNEATSYSSTITRFHAAAPKGIAKCMSDARARGAKVELWLLTRPDVYSAQQLENELFEADLLADRKRPAREGPGEMFVIRHRITNDYFVVSNRSEPEPTTIMSKFLYRLQKDDKGRNQKLFDFITNNAGDVLKQVNFDITFIDKFVDNDDLWLKRQIFIDDQTRGTCLNLNSVE